MIGIEAVLRKAGGWAVAMRCIADKKKVHPRDGEDEPEYV